MIRQFELVERVKAYDKRADEEVLNRAYVFAMKAHGAGKRESGDSFFSHPLEVAGILTHYKLDYTTIVTALLHDTIEDTDATLDDIRSLFGDEVAQLVDGVTKLSRIELQSERAKQGQNLRKLVLAVSDDIRVLLIKLADRLHNMRTLRHLSEPARRRRIAAETLEIYARLAECIGMNEVQSELEDLAFAELNPDARSSIIARLGFLREQSGELIPRIVQELRELFAANGLRAAVLGREKTPYSIWLKMQRKNVGFEQPSDIMAFRVIVGSIEDCYRALGIIHGAYQVIPGRFKDYISIPKPNGYQSLHTGVLGPDSQRIEIQIRTREMHEVAEVGVAAHWMYKQGLDAKEGRQYKWLRDLLEILEQAATDYEEFLAHTKLAMFRDQVFCFTPKGDVISLPDGASAVDFAYAVHSEVGDHCVGAKINGRLKPLRTQLQNGDQVDIVTSKAQRPSPTWERFVVTAKARARIRRYIRSKLRDEHLRLGRALVERQFHEAGYQYYDKALEGIVKNFKQGSVDDVLAHVGAGYVTARTVVETVYPELRRPKSFVEKVVPLARLRNYRAKKDPEPALPIRGLIPGMAMHFAGCCHPLPGDRIVGIVTTGKGVTIHTIDCESLEAFSDMPERWIDVAWEAASDQAAHHVGRIHLTVLNEPGTLGSLTTAIGRNEGNITNLKITNRSLQFFDMLIDIEVRDVRHLTNIIAALRATPSVNSVDRAYG
jgi:GTP pyrophosphokinase